MSVPGLETPLQVLSTLPNLMKWMDTWDSSTQYYLNDIVVSPIDSSSYILTGKTALLNGGDPSTNADWYQVTSTGGGGGLTIVGGTSITATTVGSTVTITNDGLRSFGVSSGIDNGGTFSDPLAENAGIISITAGAGIEITSGQNPTISAKVAQLSSFNQTIVAGYIVADIGPSGSGIINVTALSGKFSDYLLNGAPDANGCFLLDLNSYSFSLAGSGLPIIDSIGVELVGNTGTYTPVGAGFFANQTSSLPQQFAIGKYVVNVADFRSTAGSVLQSIRITNGTSIGTIVAGTALGGPSTPIPATYYPYGLE